MVGAKDKYDLMRFDANGQVSGQMFAETWRRYVVKMATGSGKTKVLSLVLAWSFFHRLYEEGSEMSRNFLVVAPNIIVLDRIYKDFQGLRIFFRDPVVPDNGFDGHHWRDDFQLTLHVQDDVRVTRPTGNIFLTNIHRVHQGNESIPSPDDDDTKDYFLGPRPTGKTTDSRVDLGMIVRDIDELAVLNDEAHHIHDERLAWFKSIQDIHNRLVQKGGAGGGGLALQVDVTATPRHNNGAIFVQTVADYPLVEAIWQNVVKHPVLPDAASRAKLVEVKLQTAPTIDLGLVTPDDIGPVAAVPQVRHCDVRYVVFYGHTDGDKVVLDHLVVSTGERFFTHFRRFEGKQKNDKYQIRLPSDFFNDCGI